MTDDAPLGAARRQIRGGQCETPDAAWLDLFFVERDEGSDNHGARAKAICAGCAVREFCLTTALVVNEEHGIWGGAGEQRRRTLRRAMAQDRDNLDAALDAWPGVPLALDLPPEELPLVSAAHWRALDGKPEPDDRSLLAGFGPNATHGNPATYAKGCRCDPCSLAVAVRRTAKDKFKTRTTITPRRGAAS